MFGTDQHASHAYEEFIAMSQTINKCVFTFTAFVIIFGATGHEAEAGGGSGWGWAKPLNKRQGAFYTTNKNANFSRDNRSRSSFSYRTHRQPVYRQPTTVYPQRVYPRVIHQPHVVVTPAAPIVQSTQVWPAQPSTSQRVIVGKPPVQMTQPGVKPQAVTPANPPSSSAPAPPVETTQAAVQRWSSL